jgi:carbamoyltransferase
MVNTSFNVRGEPIVCTPQDAWRCFMATDMDLLVIGNHVLRKADQPVDPSFDRARHLARFSPD